MAVTSTSPRFPHACNVVLGGTLYEGLRVAFTVTRSCKPEPNVLELEVSNLSADTRAQIKGPTKGSPGTTVLLNAGYVGTLALLYAGNVRTVRTAKDAATITTHLTAGDGDWAYSGATISASLSQGAGLTQVLQQLGPAMGVDVSQALAIAAQADAAAGAPRFSRGWVGSGKASVEVTKALNRFGLTWSIQEGKLQVLEAAKALPGTAVLLTPDTGLLGSPEPNDAVDSRVPKLTTLRCLLDPTIRPGTLLQVEATFLKGLFKAQTVKHQGDTHGSTWETQVQATAL